MNRDLKNNVYQLQRRFGVYVDLYVRQGDTSIDYSTGIQLVNYGFDKRIKVVLLPINYFVHEKLAQQAAQFRGDLLVGDRELIVDYRYSVSVGDYIVYRTKRYDVIKVDDYDGAAQYALVRNIQNESVA